MTNIEIEMLQALLYKLSKHIDPERHIGSPYGASMDKALVLDTAAMLGAYWDWGQGQMPSPSTTLAQ